MALAALALAACAALTTPALWHVAPSSLGPDRTMAQQISIDAAGQHWTIDAATEIDSNHLRVVLMALGLRALSLDYDGDTLQAEKGSVPFKLPPEQLINDLLLAYTPLDALRAALPSGWSVDAVGNTRTLLRNGQIVAVVTYLSGNPPAAQAPWASRIKLEHRDAGYILTIDSAATDSE